MDFSQCRNSIYHREFEFRKSRFTSNNTFLIGLFEGLSLSYNFVCWLEPSLSSTDCMVSALFDHSMQDGFSAAVFIVQSLDTAELKGTPSFLLKLTRFSMGILGIIRLIINV